MQKQNNSPKVSSATYLPDKVILEYVNNLNSLINYNKSVFTKKTFSVFIRDPQTNIETEYNQLGLIAKLTNDLEALFHKITQGDYTYIIDQFKTQNKNNIFKQVYLEKQQLKIEKETQLALIKQQQSAEKAQLKQKKLDELALIKQQQSAEKAQLKQKKLDEHNAILQQNKELEIRLYNAITHYEFKKLDSQMIQLLKQYGLNSPEDEVKLYKDPHKYFCDKINIPLIKPVDYLEVTKNLVHNLPSAVLFHILGFYKITTNSDCLFVCLTNNGKFEDFKFSPFNKSFANSLLATNFKNFKATDLQNQFLIMSGLEPVDNISEFFSVIHTKLVPIRFDADKQTKTSNPVYAQSLIDYVHNFESAITRYLNEKHMFKVHEFSNDKSDIAKCYIEIPNETLTIDECRKLEPSWFEFLDKFKLPNITIPSFLANIYATFFIKSENKNAIFIKGPGGQGKSAILNAMASKIGTDASSSMNLKQNRNFEFSSLYRKRFVVVNDAGSTVMSGPFYKMPWLKEVITRESIEMDIKFIPKFSYTSNAHIWISTNNNIKLDDDMSELRRMCYFELDPAKCAHNATQIDTSWEISLKQGIDNILKAGKKCYEDLMQNSTLLSQDHLDWQKEILCADGSIDIFNIYFKIDPNCSVPIVYYNKYIEQICNAEHKNAFGYNSPARADRVTKIIASKYDQTFKVKKTVKLQGKVLYCVCGVQLLKPSIIKETSDEVNFISQKSFGELLNSSVSNQESLDDTLLNLDKRAGEIC